MLAQSLGLVLFLLGRILGLNRTGQVYNSVYQIEHYYGSRDKEFFQYSSLVTKQLSAVK